MHVANRMFTAKSIGLTRRASVIGPSALLGVIDGRTPPSAARMRPARPGRIVRSEYLRLASLESAQRSALIDKLYDVYGETVSGFTRDEFEAQVVGAEVRLVLFYGAGDELAGFSYASIERMEHASRTYAVFCAGAFFRLGYHSGAFCAIFGLRQALRFKLREPRTPLAYFTRSSSPAVYHLLASTMPRIYPSLRHQTPADIEVLVRAFSAQRRYVPVGEGTWVVRTPAMPHDASRLRRLEHDPDVRFYAELNPRFAAGEALLVWIPLDAANIVGGLFRAVRARLKQ